MKRALLVIIFLAVNSFLSFIPASCGANLRKDPGIYYNPTILSGNYTLAKIKLYNDFKTFNECGLKEVYFLVKSESQVFYNSTYYRSYRFEYDALSLALTIADKFNLTVHAWFVVGRDSFLISQNESYAMRGIDNATNDWIIFYHPDIKTLYLNMIAELIQNYSIKGIHLDYIRYPSYYSYDNYTRQIFKEKYGFDPKDDPENPLWKQWRKDQVSQFVNETYTLIKSIDLDKQLSCSVLGDPENFLQEWPKWESLGIVDFLNVQNYEREDRFFIQNLEDNLKRWNKIVPLKVVVGLYQWELQERSVDLIKEKIKWQITEVFKHGFSGFDLFRDTFLYPYKDAFPIEPVEPSPFQKWIPISIAIGLIVLGLALGIYFLWKF
ncbi:MAG: family 10 glycosylhydrolase [Candidatus Aenigmatarchaeota archaeon]